MLDFGYFRLARNTSFLSTHRVRVGCVLAKKVPLIACCNKLITHPIYANGSDIRCSLHAEIRAVINCKSNLTGSTAYVYRETVRGSPALAKPCVYCEEVLREAGIKKVYYTIAEFPFYEVEYL